LQDMRYFSRVSILLFLVFTSLLAGAQQSSKSKSKERFREKDTPDNRVTVQNALILNSKSNDYSPIFYQNGIVYVSSRKRNGAQDKKTGETFSELYFAPFDPNGAPAGRQNFSLNINSKLHEGPVTFNREYTTMFYTQNNQKSGVQKSDQAGVVRLKIYQAQKGAIDWEPLGELPFNSNEYSCVHPSLSADGRRLYFASDMPGGLGSYDIYYSERQEDGSWGSPINAGNIVNTPKTELFPFIHPSGTLFFSSSGHEFNLGGYDIYYYDQDENGDESVVNMDAPYNTPFDDLGFIIDDELKRGFFTSNRQSDERGLNGSIGKDDIWMFSIEKGIQQFRPAEREGLIVVRDVAGNPIKGAEVRILKASNEGFVDTDSSVYEIDLQPTGTEPGNVSLQLRPKSPEKMRRPDLYTNLEGTAMTGFLRYRSYVVLVTHPDYLIAQQFVNVEDEAGIQQVEITLLDAPTCHKAVGTVITDQLGTRIANANLRFIHKATNKIQSTRTGLNGDYEICLSESGEYLVQVERSGFQSANFILYARNDQPDFHETRLKPTKIGEEQPIAGGISDGSVVVLDKIAFEPTQTTLNQAAIRNLDAIYDLLMRYPDFTADIISHTDTRGNPTRNLNISKERANNAVAYLVYRGIPEGRLKAIGKGGQEPRNQCKPGTNCSEEEHRINVRFEVKIHAAQP